MVDVVYGNQTARLPLLVVAGKGPSLLGRDWPLNIRLDLQGLHRLQPAPPTDALQAVLDKHSAVFTDELGQMKGVKAKLNDLWHLPQDPSLPQRESTHIWTRKAWP